MPRADDAVPDDHAALAGDGWFLRRRAGAWGAGAPRARAWSARACGSGAACVTVRRAGPADAAAIGAVHVAAWRSAYPAILPEAYLARLSVARQARHYEFAIRSGAQELR